MQPRPQSSIIPLLHRLILHRPVLVRARLQTLDEGVRIGRDEIGDRVAGARQAVCTAEFGGGGEGWEADAVEGGEDGV